MTQAVSFEGPESVRTHPIIQARAFSEDGTANMRPSSSQPELQTLLSRHGLSLHLEMSGSRGSNLISTQHLITLFSFICSEEV